MSAGALVALGWLACWIVGVGYVIGTRREASAVAATLVLVFAPVVALFALLVGLAGFLFMLGDWCGGGT